MPNQPPKVALTAPQANQLFVAPATVKLAAEATDADGKVVKVDFYQGTTLLGTATQAPYIYDWKDVPVGTYTVTAQATDNKGGVTVTPPLSVSVLAQMKGVFYIHPDHLGTPRVVTDDKNKTIWQNDPLGEPFGATAPDEDPDGDKIKFTLNLRFPGQYFDQETGAHYNYFRDNYLPEVGRYGQGDPIGLNGGLNTYVYVNGNPVSLTDPQGLMGYGGVPAGYGLTSSTNNSKAATCQRDCTACKKVWLHQNYGDFVSDTLVPSFSVLSYVPGSPYVKQAWSSTAISVGTKGAIGVGVAVINKTAAAIGAGAVSAVATGAGAFATTADVMAANACGC